MVQTLSDKCLSYLTQFANFQHREFEISREAHLGTTSKVLIPEIVDYSHEPILSDQQILTKRIAKIL